MLNNFIAIGDSHVTFLEQAKIMRSHWLGPLNIVTLYKLLNNPPELFSIKESLAHSAHYKNVGVYPWQCPSGVYDVPNPRAGDRVVFSFGFNDVQKNISKYHHNNPELAIDKLIVFYVHLLKMYKHEYGIIPIPLSIPPNPAPRENESYGLYLYGIGGEFNAHGTTEERHRYTNYANGRLMDECENNGLKFLYLYDFISCEDGFLKKEYTEDFVHLRHDNLELVNKIKYRIDDLGFF